MTTGKKLFSTTGATMLTARKAARTLGCAPDYVGRLCREGKLEGTLHQGAWYIDPVSLSHFEAGREAARASRAESLASQRREETRAYSYANKSPIGKVASHIVQKLPTFSLSKHAGAVVLASVLLGGTVFAASSALVGDYGTPSQFVAAVARVESPFFSPSLASFEDAWGKLAALFVPKKSEVAIFVPTTSAQETQQGNQTMQTQTSALPAAHVPSQNSGGTTIVNNTYPVIERTVEKATAVAGVSEEELTSRLQELSNHLHSDIYSSISQPLGPLPSSGGPVNNTALSQVIDKLQNVTITNATFNGVSGLTTADLPDLSGEYLALAGGTLTGGLTLTSATTTATSTLAGLQLADLDCTQFNNGGKLTTDVSGNIVCDNDNGGSGSGSPGGNNTYVQFNDLGGFGGNAGFTYNKATNRATIIFASTTALTSTYASSTNLSAGTANIGSLTLLQALSPANGGTGLASAPAYGQVLVGNNAGGYTLVATSSLGIASAVWGNITGSLSAQTDLQSALDAKVSTANFGVPLYNYLSATTTSALAEGSNLYYTPGRVQTYLDTLDRGYFFSTTSANYFAAASSTIAKTYANNSFAGTQSFATASTTALVVSGLGSAAGQCLTVDSSGTVTTTACGSGGGSSFAYPFAGNATSTLIAFNGGLSASSLTAANSTLTYASSTALTVSGTGYFGTASTTNLTVSGVPSGLLKTINGVVSAAIAGTDYQAAGNYDTFGYLFPSNATSTSIAFNGGITAALSASFASTTLTGNTVLQNATSSTLFATIASTTNLFATNATISSASVANTATVGNLINNGVGANQILYANNSNKEVSVATSSVTAGTALSFSGTAGALVGGSSLTINFAAPTTAALSIPYASSTALTATNLYSSNASTTALNISGVSNSLLKTVNGVVSAAVAGTDYQVAGNYSTAAYPFALAGNATSTLTQFNGGLTAYASTTIGSGLQLGGLTISGGATTTGKAFFANNVGIGTQPTSRALEISGTAKVSSTFTLGGVTSCSGSQALQTNGSGDVSCGNISVGGASTGGGWSASGGITNGLVSEATTTYAVAIGATTTPEGYAKLAVLSGDAATTTLALLPASGATANVLDVYDNTGVLSSVITAGGFLGLGTTSPQSRLAVSGGASIGADYNAAAPTNGLVVEGNLGVGTPTTNFEGISNTSGMITAYNQTGKGALELANGTDDDEQPIGQVDFTATTQTGALTLQTASIEASLSGPTANNRGSMLQFFTRADGGSNVITERARIDNNGNVQIGTTTVYARLTVDGGIYAVGDVTGTNLTATGTLAVSGLSSLQNASTTVLSASTLCLSTDCRTAWPAAGSIFAYPFALAGNATSTLTQFNGGLTAYASTTIGNGTQPGGLTISGGATTTGNAYIAGTLTIPGSSGISIIDNVGAGAQLLRVGDDSYLTDIDVANTLGLYGLSDNTVGSLKLGSGGGTISGYNGRIGIGTTNPADALQVGDGTSDTRLSVVSNSVNQFTAKNASGNSIKYGATTDTIPNAVISNNDGTPILTITSGGNLGIGTTSPYRALSVGGNAVVGANVLAANFTATSTSVASVFPYASSTALTASSLYSTNAFSSAYKGTTLAIGGTSTTTIDSAGNLLVQGGTSAGTSLDVNGTANALYYNVQGSQFIDNAKNANVHSISVNSGNAVIDSAGVITSNATAADTLPYASSTALTVSGTGYFGTASTTNLRISGVSNALLKTVNGLVSAAIAGVDYATVAQVGAAYPFALTGNATSTLTQFNGGLTAFASSTIGNGLNGLTISGNATTTGNAYFTGPGLTVSNSLAPTTGVVYFGNGGSNLGFDGSNYNFSGGGFTTTGGSIIARANNTIYGVGVQYNQSDGGYWLGATNSATPDLVFTNQGGQETARLTNGGNLGVGNSAPNYALDVNGFVNTNAASGYKQNGETVLFASSSNASLAVGASAAAAWMNASSTIWYDTAIGNGALSSTPTNSFAQNNTAIGYLTLSSITTGSGNAAIGSSALHNTTSGVDNFALGTGVLYNNTTGNYNVGIGTAALVENISGGSNVGIGRLALQHNNTGSNNVVVGAVGLNLATSSSNNTVVGYGAGQSISGASGTVGGNNTLFGNQAGGDITTGGYNTILGSFGVGSSITTGSNNILIGQDVKSGLAQTGSNQLNIGNLIFGTNVNSGATLSTGYVGIGTSTPASLLSLNGTGSGNGITFGNNASTNLYGFIGDLKTDTNLDVTGQINASSNLDLTGNLYARAQLDFLNKAANGWVTFATRNTTGTEAVYDLTNIGSLTANSATISYASSTALTATGLFATNAALTYASSTAITATSAYATNLTVGSLNGLLKATNGLVSAAISGTDYAAFGYPFVGNATSTSIAFNGGITAALSASFASTTLTGNTVLQNATSSTLFATIASTTNLFATNAALSSLTLQNALSVANGGTGSTTLGGILTGNGTGQLTAAAVSGPLTFSSNTLSIAQATRSISGYLSGADFTTFDNKISSSSLSGASVINYTPSSGVITTAGGTFGAGAYIFPGNVTAPYASSTALTATNAFFTNASTTALNISGIPSALLKTVNGVVSAAIAGTDYLTAGAIFGYPFPSNATSTSIAFNGGISAAVSAQFASTTLTGNTFAQNATTTALGISSITSKILKTDANGTVVGASAGTDYEVPLTFSTGLNRSGNIITSTGVTAATGTLNQINTDVNTGSITLSLPTLVTLTNLTVAAATTTNEFISSTLAASTARFGKSATTTIDAAGNLAVAGTLNGAGLSTCGGSTDKLLWSGGNFLCGTDAGAGGTSEINWTYFNGSGVRVSTSTNQVLIGATATTSLAKLQVVGGSLFDNATSTNSLFGAALSANVAAFGQSATTTIDQAGNVGIGTSSPIAHLAVNGGNILQVASGSPTLAASVATSHHTYASAVVGHYAYTADLEGGLRIIDVTNPKNPATVGSYTGISAAVSVAVAGKYAYVGDTSAGLVIVDVSNPAHPALVSSTHLAQTPWNLVVSGKYVYIADANGGVLDIVDVSNPAAPAVAGTWAPGGSGQPYGLAVSGKYAYVGDIGNSSIYIVDISNPAAPSTVGTYSATGITPVGLYASGKYLYVADGGKGFYTLNVSNPASIPAAVGSYNPSGTYYGVQVAGSYAYLADNTGNATVLDVSNEAVPQLVGSYATGGNPQGITVAGKYAYVSSYSSGLVVVDINGATLPAADIGSLGAGTANISDALTVGGDISAGGGLDVGISGIFSRGTIAAYVASSTQVNPVVASFMGGNVGIGTTTAPQLLTLSASDANTSLTSAGLASLAIINSNTTANNTADLVFKAADTAGATVVGTKFASVFTSHTAGAVSADLAFLTRSAGTLAERMRLTAAGFLGIGTTSPGTALSVNGAAVLAGQVTGQYFTATSTLVASNFPYASSTALTATNLFTTNLTVGSLNGLLKATNGLVSAAVAGTDYSTANYPFALVGNATSTLTQFNGGLTAFASSTIGNGTLGLTINGPATTTGQAYFAGSVGIGTTTPQANLDIYSTGNATLNLSGVSTSVPGLQFMEGATNTAFLHYGNSAAVGGGNANHLTLATNLSGSSITLSAGGGTAALTLNGSTNIISTGNTFTAGKVGVGTTSPFAQLSVTGAGTGTGVNFQTTDNNNLPLFSILDNGNVGIGTTTPGTKLGVNGDAVLAGLVTAQRFAATSTALASVFPYASSTALTVSGALYTPVTSSLLKTDSAGRVVAAIAGTDYANFSYPFPSNATSTLLTFSGGTSIGGTLSITGGAVSYTTNSTSTIANNTPYAWTIATSSTAAPLFRIDTTSGAEQVSVGVAGGDVTIGDVGSPANLVFEESSTIKGQGTGRTLTFGANNDILNFAVRANFNAGASTTQLSVLNGAYFGATATTTIDSAGSLTLPATAKLVAPYASSTALTVAGLLDVSGSGSINVNQYGAYKQAGNTILYASSTLGSVYVGNAGPTAYNSSATNNTLLGLNSGNLLTSGGNNTLLGAWSTGTNANLTSGSNNIAIGYNVSLPSATQNGQLNIGNLIYGMALDGGPSGAYGQVPSSGRIGIGSTTPWAKLSIHANGADSVGTGYSTTLFAIASSTNSATTTLFTVNNIGNAYVAGNLGIGTTTPGTALSVNGDSVLAGIVTGRVFTATSTLAASSFPYASTTAVSGTISQFTTASSTNLNISGIAGALLKTVNGVVTAATAGTDYLTSATSFAYPFPSSATSSALSFNGGITVNGTDGTATSLTLGGAGQLTTGKLISFGATSAGGGLSAFSGSFIFANNQRNAGVNLTDTGQYINLTRSYTPTSATVTNVNGDMADLTSSCDSTSASCNDNSHILSLTQNATSSNASALAVLTKGTGPSATFLGGNVGIGTTTPGTALSVNGAAVIAGLVTGQYFNATSTLNTSTFPYASSTALTVSGSAYLGTTGSQNVGVGSTTPWAKLSVDTSNLGANVPEFAVGSSTRNDFFISQSGTASSNAIIPNGTYTNNLSAFSLGATGSRWNSLWAGTVNVGTSTFSLGADAASNFGIYTAASQGGTEALTVTGGGNVGIGTTTPGSALTLSGASPTAQFYATGLNRYATFGITDTANAVIDTVGGGDVLIKHGGTTWIDVGNSGLYTTFNTGNVGVGTTSPWARLSVQTNYGDTNKNVFAIGSSTNSGGTTNVNLFSVDNTGISTFGDTTGTGDATFQFASDNNAWAVGYKSSDKSFNIASSTNFSGTAALSIAKNGNATFTGSGGTCTLNGSGSCTSDIRLKTNIATTTGEDALDKLGHIDTITYNWADPALDQSQRLGVIAQQVLQVFPQLVGSTTVNFKGTLGTYYTVDYGGLTAPLIAGVNELNLDLETLASTTATSTPASQGFASAFWTSVKKQVGAWLADAGNGIANIFADTITANVVNAKTLCLADDSGAKTCVTKAQLDALLSGSSSGNSQPVSGGSSSGSGSDASGGAASSTPPDNTASSTPPVVGPGGGPSTSTDSGAASSTDSGGGQ